MSMLTESRRNRSGPEWYPLGWPEVRGYPDAPNGVEHGTPEGYGYHRRNDKHPCRPCLDSWNAYQKNLAKKRKEAQARGEIPKIRKSKPGKTMIKQSPGRDLSSLKLKVYQLALRRLAEEHPSEFKFLWEEIFAEQERANQE